MASSISNSELVETAERHTSSSSLRLTAADRPGVAQPVPERDIPPQPWRTMGFTVLALLLVLTSLWEWQMRRLELVPGDLSGTYDIWAEQRRLVDQRNVPLALIGDSRILYDTDLDRVTKMTGVRPIQLGIAGGTGLLVLEEMANDPHFKGLAIVGMAETSFFDTQHVAGRTQSALALGRWESPSKRASYMIQRVIAQPLAMLDDEYQLSTLVFDLDPDWRPGVRGPYHDVWKIGQTRADGQAWLWQRLEHDRYLSAHARGVWHQLFPPFPQDDASIHDILVRSNIAVDKIRAHGGDVVFLRPPSSPDIRAIEDRHLPRARGWDALLAYTHTRGTHADDLPMAQNLVLPEGSHLTQACATVFTDAYIRSVAQQTPLLRLKRDLPPELSTHYCVQSSGSTVLKAQGGVAAPILQGGPGTSATTSARGPAQHNAASLQRVLSPKAASVPRARQALIQTPGHGS